MSQQYYDPILQRFTLLENRIALLEMKLIKLITALEFIKDMSLNSDINVTLQDSSVQLFPT